MNSTVEDFDLKAQRELIARISTPTRPIKIIEPEKPGELLSFTYKSTFYNWRVWYSTYNHHTPWRTAKIERKIGKNGGNYGLFTTHASHNTLEEAFEWLKRID